MKKLLILLPVLLLLTGCGRSVESCPAEEPAPVEAGAPKLPEVTEDTVIQEGQYEAPEKPTIEEVDITRKEPCTLQIENGSRMGDTLGGPASWWYENGDGTATCIEAERVHPLYLKEQMPVLVMDGTKAELLFSAEEPDSVRVRGWSVREWGNYDAEAEDIPVEGLTFQLKNEGFIYEVFAAWERFETWGGTACYTFCAAPLGVELHAEAVTDTGMTLVCTRSGGDSSMDLQTGSPFRLEYRDENGYWQPVPFVESDPPIQWTWTQEAWLIPQNDTMEWDIGWEGIYGSLPDGIYRIGKEIMDFRGTGDYDTYWVWSDNFAVKWTDE